MANPRRRPPVKPLEDMRPASDIEEDILEPLPAENAGNRASPIPAGFGGESLETLAAMLDQSVDCIKLVDADGTIQYMNRNGQCAMEVDEFDAIAGRPWADLWPEEARPRVSQALDLAKTGVPARFDAFCPTAKGRPRWWDVSVSRVASGDGTLIGYLAVSRDVTEARLARQVAETMTAEMMHRLKNSYAMVGGLLSALARGVPERETFVREMRGRLQALGVAQTLFVSGESGPCRVSELIEELILPFSNPACTVSVGLLPETLIDQGQADAIALVFGELSVNSTKHGALSGTGAITVSAFCQDGALVITWLERSDQGVTAHSRSGGQGLKLMQRILGARHGELKIDWNDSGLDATITLLMGNSR